MMKLYYSDVMAPRKACALARYLNAPVEFVYLDLVKGEHKTPAMLALNPNGRVPTLVDGARVVWEADAIMFALAERMNSDLWPRDAARQLETLRWLSWAAHHFNPTAGQLYFEYVIKRRFDVGPPEAAQVERATAEFRRLARILDDHLQDRAWLAGDAMTIADFSAAVTLPYAGDAHIPLAEFPAVRRWHDRLDALDAWRNPFPHAAA